MKANVRKVLVFSLMLFSILGLNYVIHSNEDFFLNLKVYGYAGIFFVCLFLNATVLLPSSSTAIVMSMATIYNPIVTAIVGALGATLGEFTGYFAGYYSSSIFEKSTIISKILNVYNRFPKLAIILFSALPLPFFDIIGIMAGSVKMDKKKFFIFCFIGKGVKMLLYAFLGKYAFDQVINIIK